MNREELLKTPEWWLATIQNELYGLIYDHMQKNNLKKKDIAEKLGVSKGYITQILKGDFDHKISKYVELALSFNKVPIIHYVDLDQYIKDDANNKGSIYDKDFKAVNYFTIDATSQYPKLSADYGKNIQMNQPETVYGIDETIAHQTGIADYSI